jgi:hypothetical protein
MKAIDFRNKESELSTEVEQAIKEKMLALGVDEINMGMLELNCPCINSGAPEVALHTVSSVELYKETQVTYNIDDQGSGYNCSEIPLDSLIELLSVIEDLDEEDLNL